MDTDVTTINFCANDVFSWFAVLKQSGFNMTSQNLKLYKETAEFVEAPSLDEAADVFISLFGAVFAHGWTMSEFAEAVTLKMQVNRQRNWEQLEDGTYQHTKETPDA